MRTRRQNLWQPRNSLSTDSTTLSADSPGADKNHPRTDRLPGKRYVRPVLSTFGILSLAAEPVAAPAEDLSDRDD